MGVDARLRAAEKQFCEDIDFRTNPETFDGGRCETCLVGQVGLSLGIYALQKNSFGDDELVLASDPDGDLDDGGIVEAITNHYLPYSEEAHDAWCDLYNDIEHVYAAVAGHDVRDNLEVCKTLAKEYLSCASPA
jgi:hypothetical protein